MTLYNSLLNLSCLSLSQFHFHFVVGMGNLGIEFGMLDVLSVVFGICWVFLHYCLGEIWSFWGLKHLDYFCMCDLGYSRVVPVYNLVFFELVNSFHLLIFGYLVDFQKLSWVEYYNIILPLYLYLGWLAPESFRSLGISL